MAPGTVQRAAARERQGLGALHDRSGTRPTGEPSAGRRSPPAGRRPRSSVRLPWRRPHSPRRCPHRPRPVAPRRRYGRSRRAATGQSVASLSTSSASGVETARPRTDPAMVRHRNHRRGTSRRRARTSPTTPEPPGASGSVRARRRPTAMASPSRVRWTVDTGAFDAGSGDEKPVRHLRRAGAGPEFWAEGPGDRLRRRGPARSGGDAGPRGSGATVRQPLRHRQQWPVARVPTHDGGPTGDTGPDDRRALDRAATRSPGSRRADWRASGRSPSGADATRCTAVMLGLRRPRGPGGSRRSLPSTAIAIGVAPRRGASASVEASGPSGATT